ncbi:hypothetical protein SLS60_000270 [Paraconiothyrium brasiliense]|uniref:Protein kinase domain-containing protein n=1 Tax=Paraconiothyrium brasiliense TaxID=300254 RepID=A0ABR3S5U0_9PLEO
METLRDAIETLRFRNANIERRNFVSELELMELMDEESIRRCLRDLGTPRQHQEELLKNIFVRKEIIKSAEVDSDTFVRELRNLSLLAHLNHQNLVELFCAYEYRGNFNFIFARADDGTLAHLLLGKTQLPIFTGSVDTMLFAMADLASAIHSVHNFTVEILDLELSGCHHDLAPRNILIRGCTFLLSDFGLSSFRSAEETSLTSFKEVRGSYVAPECQRLQNGRLETQKITKASDIWSFACILAEALTFSVLGVDGVQSFREQRKHDITEDLTWYRFFRGHDAPSPEVKSWLQSLSTNPNPSMNLTVELVQDMLSTEPKRRPVAEQVLMRLRCNALLSSAVTLLADYDAAVKTLTQFDLRIEEIRFRSWKITLQNVARAMSEQKGTPVKDKYFDLDFDLLRQSLAQIGLYLLELVARTNDTRNRTIILLRGQNTKLIDGLSEAVQLQINALVEQTIFEEINLDVPGAADLSAEAVGDNDIGMLISVKHLLSLEHRGLLTKYQDILLQHDQVKVLRELDYHSIAEFRPLNKKVLVEWLLYNEPWVDEVIGKELRDRMGAIARLLHAHDASRLPGTLRCRGFFPQASRRGFGFIYELEDDQARTLNPMTLNQLYDPTVESNKSYKPLLEYRVQLAYKLAQCVHRLHSVSWLHRNLVPSNVIFLSDGVASKSALVRNPFLLGFSASRQNHSNTTTIGPTALLDYHHPEYVKDKKRYREEFDYYSLGILLLEIGHWNSLPRITASRSFSGLTPEMFRQQILIKMVSPIARTMGSRYEQVVRVCLESCFSLAASQNDLRGKSVVDSFKQKVVDPLKEILDALTVYTGYQMQG